MMGFQMPSLCQLFLEPKNLRKITQWQNMVRNETGINKGRNSFGVIMRHTM